MVKICCVGPRASTTGKICDQVMFRNVYNTWVVECDELVPLGLCHSAIGHGRGGEEKRFVGQYRKALANKEESPFDKDATSARRWKSVACRVDGLSTKSARHKSLPTKKGTRPRATNASSRCLRRHLLLLGQIYGFVHLSKLELDMQSAS